MDLRANLYPLSLLAISIGVMALEAWRPWRSAQRQFRPRLISDLTHLVFNGHFLGVLVYLAWERGIEPAVRGSLDRTGLGSWGFFDAAATWPIWVQIVVALFVIDLVQWGVHNLLHRVPFLWEYHKVHHSVRDGEMDWIVSFRFHWMEVVVYKSVLYLPLAFFGFGTEAILTHAIFGTLIGHLNHANLNWDYGPLRYLLNNPRMHLWHHDVNGDAKSTVNFGVVFSCWDYLFGTARVPHDPPEAIGFDGVERLPKHFLGHALWPLGAWRQSGAARWAAAFMLFTLATASALVVAGGWV